MSIELRLVKAQFVFKVKMDFAVQRQVQLEGMVEIRGLIFFLFCFRRLCGGKVLSQTQIVKMMFHHSVMHAKREIHS